MTNPKTVQAQTVLLVENREQATILAALRHYQQALLSNRPGLTEFIEIATDSGAVLPLSADEIGDLCETVNFGTELDQVQDFIDWTSPHKAAFTRLVDQMNNQGWRSTRVHNGEYWTDLSADITPEAIYKNHLGEMNFQIEFSLKLDPSNTGHWQIAPKDSVGLTCFGGTPSFLDATHAATSNVFGE
ncbi:MULTISPECIES: hypothetical protein [unclassified Pseudomonas]|uniref:hypothetical protein n=1 Tax=unclassified Pseudomonas TaxID=196821 RepID=UPI000C86CC2B|nr:MULTISPECIES: hypothetical protein [unclassified Pseudomonas]PMV96474.1 hypothetical protein C1X55_19260 [Pseudomonas sp. GW460-C8]PMW23382.1 hypothetical protein C1X53_12560 [Pseudomonas sp. GW456-E6]PMW24142.1 hypothetical protein C1X40_04825 [Pseudomonas sp. GW456-11-11-14-TSB2]PMW40036.1 hypothetical protein C1X45_08135 [Pseudomonas sp. GW460-7]PMW41147.1 hypothetical protein C1X48_06770 [Pseudomonas sp. FW305-3-2-15-A-R2A1]